MASQSGPCRNHAQPERRLDMRFNKWRSYSVTCAFFGLILLMNYRRHLIENSRFADHIRQSTPLNSTLLSESLLFYSPPRYVTSVSCDKIIKGEKHELKRGFKHMLSHRPTKIPDEFFIHAAKNCTDFKTRFRYRPKPSSKEEEQFPIAFSITMHRNVEQTQRVLRALYQPQNIYCIHVDQKSDPAVLESIKTLANCFPNVFVASTLERIIYGGYSRVQAELNCMLDVLRFSGTWKYYINVASQAFPLKTNREMVQILKIYNGANDIEGLDQVPQERFKYKWMPRTRWNGEVRMDYSWIWKGPPPHQIQLLKGSGYGVFSRAFIHFVFTNRYALDLLEWSRDTYSPDEHIWATLNHLSFNPHLNTPGGFHGDPSKKQFLAAYVSWDGVEPCYSQNWVRSVCIFGIKDLPTLVSRHEFFANKFYSDFQPLALDCMEEWLRNRTESQHGINTTYYESLAFINKT